MKITRRRAIQHLTLGASGLSLGSKGISGFPQNAGLFNSTGNKLGIALVGLGNYSRAALKPALRQTQHVSLKGIVTGTPAKAKQWSEEFGLADTHVYNYANFDQIADNEDIDIIYIVLPNFMHREYTIRALEAGKHVICEKPMAMDVAECEAMIAASKKADRMLSVGYRLHYEAHHQEVMRLGKAKPYGTLNFIEAGLAYHVSDPTLWRLDKQKGGGGAIMDLGVYPIQACRYATGEEPVAVSAQAFTYDKTRFKGIYETFFWQFEFASGTVASCTTSYSSYVDRFYASCYNGWYRLHPSFNGGGSSGETRDGPMNLAKVNQQAAHMDDFSQSIIDGTPLRVHAAEGLQDLRIIEAIKHAIESGGRVGIGA